MQEVMKIPIDKTVPFPNHPFKVVDDETMEQLADSIQLHGDVITPITVRKLDDGTYQLISGHRRTHAAKKAGLTEISALIIECTDEEAVVQMVDANMQRPEILPSEKAFAYKMRLEAIKRQGRRTDLTSRPVGGKLSIAEISENVEDSERQIHRYIRLTELVPELLKLVDTGELKFRAAVELSYLSATHQKFLHCEMVRTGYIPTLRQSERMKKAEQRKVLNNRQISMILTDVAKENRICFRVSPSLKNKLDEQSINGGISRSQLLRTVSAGSENVYIADNIKEAIYNLRADVARLGNLYKLNANQLVVIMDNPLLAASDKEYIQQLLEMINSEHEELKQLRHDMVTTMERLNRTVAYLNKEYI